MASTTHTCSDYIINTEILRKQLYTNILEWMSDRLDCMKIKEVSNLLLRYIFNKIVTRIASDDPVFITTRNTIAESQLIRDLEYHKIRCNSANVIAKLERKLADCAQKMVTHVILADTPLFQNEYGIRYNGVIYSDIKNLARENPQYIKWALALQIRYSYLRLSNHGLARRYSDISSPDDGIEAFASAFNHYYTRYYSAFPDLESVFGSLGSWWNSSCESDVTVYINPPFDESIIVGVISRVHTILATSKNVTVVCTFPNWNKFPELTQFSTSPRALSTVIRKSTLDFIDYMNKGQIVHPCDILTVTIDNHIK